MKKFNSLILIILTLFSFNAFAINFNGDSSNTEKIEKNQSKSNQRNTNTADTNNQIIKIDSNQKIDSINVQFFFSYSCVECYYWHKELEKIKPKLAQAGINFILQPIIYDEPSDISAQIFYALKQTNSVSLHDEIWDGLANQDWSLNNLKLPLPAI